MLARTLLLALLLYALPTLAHATVLINEVAWMGSTANPNAEWIELANTGAAPVDLAGWHLTSSTNSPAITLTGTIAAGGYYLLVRTSAANLPQAPADQVYTGALANTGATLTLSDAASSTVDRVAGGTNWATIGGDNASKETAQREPDSSWITALATPRAANAAKPQPSPQATSSYQVQAVPAPPPALINPAHDEQVVSAPAAPAHTAAAGAAFASNDMAAMSSSDRPKKASIALLITSPWTLGFLGLLVFSAGALIVL